MGYWWHHWHKGPAFRDHLYVLFEQFGVSSSCQKYIAGTLQFQL